MKIAVVGAGAWGTTVAALLSEKGYQVSIWCRESEVAESINKERKNSLFLPEVTLPPLEAFTEFQKLKEADLLVNAVPVQFIRDVWENIKSYLNKPKPVVNLSKGIEVSTGKRVSEIFSDLFGEIPYAVLSGPSFAAEVALKKPTAVSVASKDLNFAEKVQHIFHTRFFRVYTHHDVTGVELAGALKNVFAIAAGISDGLNLGLNARASLINRSIVEMAKLGKAMGAKIKTFWGLAGMGDLVLTCTGDLSRNRSVGLRIGKGEKLSDIVKSMKSVAEGVETTKAVYRLSYELGIDMPIATEVYKILFENKEPLASIKNLMEREPKFEFYWIED